jgi:allantoate deiminase
LAKSIWHVNALETAMPISSERLANDVTTIATATDTPGQGASRPTFSDAWAKAVAYVVDEARRCGCSLRSDSAGNVHLRPSVHQHTNSVWLSGSHLDTVPHGGDFDGVIGVLAPLEVLRAAQEDGEPAPPLEVIIFAEEEGTTFGLGMTGSQIWVGSLDATRLGQIRNASGQSYLEAGSRHGVQPERLADERVDPAAYRGFIELHIEQGPGLWTRGEPVAVVTSIAGRRQWEVEVTGVANHAGATKMADRHDALAAAAEMISFVEALPINLASDTVATVGRITCQPNATNVIAGCVRFSIDFRARTNHILDEGEGVLQQNLNDIGRRRKVDVRIQPIESIEATPLSPVVCNRLAASAKRLGCSLPETVSGALHDAGILAPLIPTAMMFIASRDGISHNPAEWSRIEDVALATRILYTAVAGGEGEIA